MKDYTARPRESARRRRRSIVRHTGRTRNRQLHLGALITARFGAHRLWPDFFSYAIIFPTDFIHSSSDGFAFVSLLNPGESNSKVLLSACQDAHARMSALSIRAVLSSNARKSSIPSHESLLLWLITFMEASMLVAISDRHEHEDDWTVPASSVPSRTVVPY